ncbi:TetR/AcrR family transcriptional regulator [Ktedonobacter racemifer]|jgi:AcrR family transcriptional regulator|uniref:Transcriptional regulator, TetR family n=1 Tax=Ktedonobacter racemifer DSM 44963 TaxID=485913 RepID=D6U0S4_KTERA|nr:TetR/AcrR family transcriptional regulator [Ktedonobacter racemifer]EFH82414.1 transcriptional regulator, TetR family [Ktedonobacter racemifer DSM 44963]
MGKTREKILEAAEKLLLLKGSAHVTTKEIAREVGLSESALYRHFDHKEDIFFALMAEHLPAFHEVFQTRQAGTATVRENLIALALAVLHYYEQLLPMGVSFLADKELLAQFRATTLPLGMGPHNVFERFAAYLEEEQRLERIGRHLPSLTIATLLLGPCFQRVFNQQFLGFDPFHQTEQQFAEELVQGLLAGIQPS